ncbi:hypothetical protein MASSI9I_51311 [Massilia sp. 9I]|nr:hypothetical protein MASSI9I_51311 [Massilia sp. 9I]
MAPVVISGACYAGHLLSKHIFENFDYITANYPFFISVLATHNDSIAAKTRALRRTEALFHKHRSVRLFSRRARSRSCT